MNDNRIDTLAQMFMTKQDIELDSARRIAEKIAKDEVILDAALTWATTGEFGSQPNLDGHSPSSLSTVYRPTQVFTILLGLRRDPEHAKKMLRSYGSNSVGHMLKD